MEDSEFEIVQSVDIQNPFNLKNFSIDKKTILDVKAKDSKGRLYDIEVQSTGDRNYVHRSLYYWAKLYTSQLTEGDIYSRLRPTICINILNFEIFNEIPKAHSCFLLTEKDDQELVLSDHLQLHFIELLKLKEFQNMTKLERWLYFLIHEGKEDPLMKFLIKDDQDIAKAHKVYSHFTQDDRMREAYEARMKWLKDYNSAIFEATEKGKEEGREEGIVIGIDKGMDKGVKKVALKMWESGLSREEISGFTGLSIETIEKLVDDLKNQEM